MRFLAIFLLVFAADLGWAADEDDMGMRVAAQNDVTWTTLGKNENDSMPIGNGDLAANVWTEQNGDLVLLLAKSDAWTELGKLVKLGRVRISLKPNPFAGTADFAQVLKLEKGAIELRSGGNLVRVWVDANQPVMRVETRLEQPAELQARLEMWRDTPTLTTPLPLTVAGFSSLAAILCRFSLRQIQFCPVRRTASPGAITIPRAFTRWFCARSTWNRCLGNLRIRFCTVVSEPG